MGDRRRIQVSAKYPTERERNDRTEWSHGFFWCWICGWTTRKRWPHKSWLPHLETHEMVRKSQSPRKWCHPANFFRVCQHCHQEDIPYLSLARQLAYKKMHDSDNYSVSEIIRILGRGPDAVTEEDVLNEFKEIYP